MHPIEALDHVALMTRNAAASAAFYQEWAGMEVIHERNDGAHVVWVRLPGQQHGLTIVMIESPEERPRGYVDHLGFHVTSRTDVDDIATRAKEAGILSDGPSYGGPVVGYFCVIRDPDGNELEFSCEQFRV
jgi:catechol 2,3-dioxygenase-like lactoylglutathione lyase family enzyme